MVLNNALEQAIAIDQSIDSSNTISDYIQNHKQLNVSIKGLDQQQQIGSLNITITEAVQVIINNLIHSKYIYSILLTGLVKKIIDPAQDIRIAQENMANGYSNRSTDQLYITPFLAKHNFTHCAKSGMESGRNWERPEVHTFGHSAKSRGKGTKEAYLGIIHAVQLEAIDPFPIIVLLLALDKHQNHSQEFIYNHIENKLTIDKIWEAFLEFYQQARGNGKSRIPVLAIHAIYAAIMPQMQRYNNKLLREPNRHTSNDKEGWIGDIQIDNLDNSPYEAVEVKSGMKIDVSMIRILPRKLAGNLVDRYYILSTEDVYIDPSNEAEIKQAVEAVQLQTGCQIIPNGLNRTIWYYLRLLDDPSIFLDYFTQQIYTDSDIKDPQKILWQAILQKHVGGA